MKKSEITQLTQIIEALVTREVRKQLPKLIGEVFSNMTGKAMVMENIHKEVQPSLPKTTPNEFKASLKDLFAGTTPVTKIELEEGIHIAPKKVMRHFTKDPVLNQILNETTPDLKSREGLAGMAAMAAGYNSSVPMAGNGQMATAAPSVISENHIPLESIPEGISALDVARAGMTPAPVTEALTNYDRMKKILEASKSKRY